MGGEINGLFSLWMKLWMVEYIYGLVDICINGVVNGGMDLSIK